MAQENRSTDMEPAGLVIRAAQAGDDLTPVYTAEEAALPWNRDQMVVALQDGLVVGIALFVDGGHPVLWLENIRMHPDARGQGIGTRLLHGVAREAKRRGCQVILGAAHGEAYCAFLVRHGVKLRPEPCYLAIARVDDYA